MNRTTGITAEAVDNPEALSLRGGFTRAAGKRNMHVDSRTAFGFMTAILQVLDGIAWPWNQATHARASLAVTPDNFRIWSARAREFCMRQTESRAMGTAVILAHLALDGLDPLSVNTGEVSSHARCM